MLKKLVAWSGILLLAGCSTIKTDYDYNEDINFSELKTWSWLEHQASNDDSGYKKDGLNDRRIRESIEQELTTAGFTKAQDNSAQVLVNYLTSVEKKTDTDTFYTSFGYFPTTRRGLNAGIRAETRTREYKEGTLVVDIIDASKRELLWRGAGSDKVKQGLTPSERTQSIQEVVKRIFEGYPPKQDN